MSDYRKVFDPVKEGNPAPIVKPNNEYMPCLGDCGGHVDSADGLCTDCWIYRHDARVAGPPVADVTELTPAS